MFNLLFEKSFMFLKYYYNSKKFRKGFEPQNPSNTLS